MKNITTVFLLFFAVSLTFSQVDLGEKVPNFKALDQDGEKWVLKSNLKKSDYLVIYFYPAAFTGGCTAQACSYRDQKGDLEKVGASVAGVSGDSPETLKLFALEHSLNFTMLADESGALAAIFDVPHGDGGTIQREIKGASLDLTRGTTIQRWTFILDQDGELIYKDTEVDAAGDSDKVLEFVGSLQ
ncbi:MAG: redoxin domain-containing protein [Bacteroidales bacterium]|nr:redoxin domain-containing protein [Bacteroidales bacterium]